ncbi:hypothetical protein SNE40_021674 [Patella caerulea]|uniref:Endonuclease/exonuclease/phosphatase domain-containing protein n=1 Tax=Patella caerulea TaxID=87958 RepID=A0AAN8G8G2_PATCE
MEYTLSQISFSIDIQTVFCFINISPSGIINLENNLNEILLRYGCNVQYLVAGDLNARVGEEQDFIQNDDTRFINVEYDTDDFDINRKSKDKVVNSFGRSLLSICKSFDIHMLNGRTSNDKDGNFTFVSHVGKSVNYDDIIGSTSLYNNITGFEIADYDTSDHFPLCCSVKLMAQKDLKSNEAPKPWHRLKWKADQADNFVNNVKKYLNVDLRVSFLECKDSGDTNGMVVLLHEAISNVGKHSAMMICRNPVKLHTTGKQPIWWDNECNLSKNNKYMLLNRCRLSNTDDDLARTNNPEIFKKSVDKSAVFVKEDSSPEVQKIRSKLYPIFVKAIELVGEKENIYLRNDKLIIGSNSYGFDLDEDGIITLGKSLLLDRMSNE